MFDNSDVTKTYSAVAMPSPKGLGADSSKPMLDQEPAWKSDFRRTLDEINNVGFGAYTDEIQARKMEELREKILASMGLTEGDLENMSPEQQGQIEKMIAMEIQARLAAEDALDEDSASPVDDATAVANQLRAAPNGLGTMLLALQEIDAAHDPDEQTG